MLIIQSDSNNPYYNLAVEEILLKKLNDNILFIYRNTPSVILGKHQNALKEVNYKYIRDNKVPVVRRLSGGGTVYHDMGNVNFTFFQNSEEGRLVDFKRYTSLIIEFLNTLGINTFFGGNNDIRTNEYKLSGNAEHVFKKRVMHHGTLLFNSNIDKLKASIKNTPEKFIDKAVKSVPAKVNNISNLINEKYTVEEFTDRLVNYFVTKKKGELITLGKKLSTDIEELVQTKYTTWDWNFGYSPKYSYQNKFVVNKDVFDLKLDVLRGGDIERAGILKNEQEEISLDFLIGCKHEYDSLQKIFNSNVKVVKAMGLTTEELLKHFF